MALWLETNSSLLRDLSQHLKQRSLVTEIEPYCLRQTRVVEHSKSLGLELSQKVRLTRCVRF